MNPRVNGIIPTVGEAEIVIFESHRLVAATKDDYSFECVGRFQLDSVVSPM